MVAAHRPAKAIAGVVTAAKAGVGSTVNAATRLLGGTLGVAVIGAPTPSCSASGSRPCSGTCQPSSMYAAHSSVGAALQDARGLKAGFTRSAVRMRLPPPTMR